MTVNAAKNRPGRRHPYAVIARVSLQTALTYRANVLSGFLFYAMFLFVFYCLWRAIYSGGGVNGLDFNQMIWYLCVTELISYGARSNVCPDISRAVKTGEIVYQLNRPYHYLFYQMASAVGQIGYQLACFGVLAVATGLLAVGPLAGFRWITLPFCLLSMLLGIAINFVFHMAIGLSAFRFEENSGLYLVYSKLVFMLGTFIPLEFLPGWLASVARCLPFSYVAWAPARLLVGFDWAMCGQFLALQCLWLFAGLGLSLLLYRWGMRTLQGMGG